MENKSHFCKTEILHSTLIIHIVENQMLIIRRAGSRRRKQEAKLKLKEEQDNKSKQTNQVQESRQAKSITLNSTW